VSVVSIVIPCYNRQWLVKRAIESALAQRYSSIEVIVVDDGSTDASWSHICGYRDTIRAARIENGGASRARNHGIRLCQGKYVKFLDSDDVLPANAVQEMVNDAKRHTETTIIVGQATCIDTEGRTLPIKRYNYRGLEPGREIPLATLLGQSTSVSMPLFPRIGLQAVNGFREGLIIYEDYDLMVRLYVAGYRPYYTSTLAAAICVHDADRVSTRLRPVAFQTLSLMYRDIWQLLNSTTNVRLTSDETTALARLIWVMARDACRLRFKSEARTLFDQAFAIAGSRAFVGHPILRAMYRFLNPVIVEEWSMELKALIG